MKSSTRTFKFQKSNCSSEKNGPGKSAIIDAVRRVLGTHSLDWNPIVDDDFFRDAMRLRIEINIMR